MTIGYSIPHKLSIIFSMHDLFSSGRYTKIMSSDVIIVGAGIAGLMCAYDCVQNGRSVVILYQDLDHTSSFYAKLALLPAVDDSPLQHMTDTIMAGDGSCDTRIVQDFTCDHLAFIQRLIDLGVPFDCVQPGEFRLTKEALCSMHEFFM